MDEVTKIVLRSNKERKLLSDSNVKRICQLSIKDKYPFVKNIIVFPSNFSDNDCAAVYYKDSIYFFKENIEELVDNCYVTLTKRNQLDGTKMDIYNYFYLCIIFHELEHVRQHDIVLKKDNHFERKLYSLCFQLSQNREFYDQNYHDFLTEIRANNVASIKANNIYNHLPREYVTDNDLNVYNLTLLKEMLRDNYEVSSRHEIVYSPFEKLMEAACNTFKNFGIEEYQKIMDDSKKLSLYRKVLMGLPISYLEFAYANLLYETISSGEDINVVKKLQKKNI